MDPDTETAAEVRKLRRTIIAIVVAAVLAGGGYVAVDMVQKDRAEDGSVIANCVNDAIAAGREPDYCY